MDVFWPVWFIDRSSLHSCHSNKYPYIALAYNTSLQLNIEGKSSQELKQLVT